MASIVTPSGSVPVNSGDTSGSTVTVLLNKSGGTTEPSKISEFYGGKTIFITGGTGFMGKVLLEKLLRSCPGVGRIYLLIRPKRGQNAHERLENLLCSPLFDEIRKSRPASLAKVQPIEGDITQSELAISTNDRQMLARTVNVVFHSAATVKFDEKLKISVTINILGTKRLVNLCKRMSNLEALVHVSTAYCNCDRGTVDEVIYPPPIDPDHVMALVEYLDETLLDKCTGPLVGQRPNTYTFTKALAESWLLANHGDLPLAIVRPSIVLCTVDGPLKGWVDNLNGPTGIVAAAGKGIFRSMLCDPDKVADVVPVDVVINLLIVSAWNVARAQVPSAPQIYNCSTGLRNPITWHYFIQLCFKYMRQHPFSEVTWYPNGTLTPSPTVNNVNLWLLHWLPAKLMDMGLWACGSKPIMMRIQDKLSRAATCLYYFTTNQWRFNDDNVKSLNDRLSADDQIVFGFDVATRINWDVYIEAYVLGIRRFIFKEEVGTLPRARQQMVRLYWLHRAVQMFTVLVTWHFVSMRYTPLRKLWAATLRLLLTIMLRLLPFN